jgi:hypothetical protein
MTAINEVDGLPLADDLKYLRKESLGKYDGEALSDHELWTQRPRRRLRPSPVLSTLVSTFPA